MELPVEQEVSLKKTFQSEEDLSLVLDYLIEEENKFIRSKQIDLLNPEQARLFKEYITEANGVLRVSIHPTHVGPEALEYINDDWTFKLDDYPPVKVLKRTISNPKAPPTLLFVNESQVSGLRSALEDSNTFNGVRPIYIAPTLNNFGVRKLIGYDDPESNGIELALYAYEGMNRLIPLLCESGVKKILVDGASLEVREDGPEQCVGTFIGDFDYINKQMIEAGVDGIYQVKIQVGATVPHGRRELRNAGFTDFL